MMPMNATLAITGVYTVLIAWIFIAAVTWSWWTPFKEVQSLARGGITAPLPKLVPDALLATLILLFTQGCWYIFTFGQIMTLYMATDSNKDPHRNAYLTNALALWSMISVLCIVGGIKLAAISYRNLRQIGFFPKEFRPRLRREHWRENNFERPARRLARFRDSFHADVESAPGYGTFYNLAEDEGYDAGTESHYPSDHRRSRTLPSSPFLRGCPDCEEMLLELASEQGDPHPTSTAPLQGLSYSPQYESPINGSQASSRMRMMSWRKFQIAVETLSVLEDDFSARAVGTRPRQREIMLIANRFEISATQQKHRQILKPHRSLPPSGLLLPPKVRVAHQQNSR